MTITRSIAPLLLITTLVSASTEAIDRQLDPLDRSGSWSLGARLNAYSSPYANGENYMDFMPQIFYSGEKFYFHTNELGFHAYETQDWQLDVFADYLVAGYNDYSFAGSLDGTESTLPTDNDIVRDNTVQAGTRLAYKTNYGSFIVEFAQDISNKHRGYATHLEWNKVWDIGELQVEPWLRATHMSSDLIDFYTGAESLEPTVFNSSIASTSANAIEAGLALRYRYYNRHHFALIARARKFEDSFLESPLIGTTNMFSAAISYRYVLDYDQPPSVNDSPYSFFDNNPNPWSFRLAYGCDTKTTMNAIVRGDVNCGGTGANISSLFFSRKLADSLWGTEFESWVTAGAAQHFDPGYDENFGEFVLAFKAVYRDFGWSDTVQTRIGIGQGISYATEVPYAEVVEAEYRNQKTSRLLNYLDASIDFSVGDIFNIDSIRSCFFGFSIHHRSGMFGASNIYNNHFGGSNANTLYVECEYP